jgi:hypothetical protein
MTVFSLSFPKFLLYQYCNISIVSRKCVVINISSTKLSTDIRAYPFIFPNIHFSYLHTLHKTGAIGRVYFMNYSFISPSPNQIILRLKHQSFTFTFELTRSCYFLSCVGFSKFSFSTWTCWVYFTVAEDQKALLQDSCR